VRSNNNFNNNFESNHNQTASEYQTDQNSLSALNHKNDGRLQDGGIVSTPLMFRDVAAQGANLRLVDSLQNQFNEF